LIEDAIICFQQERPAVDTQEVFSINQEGEDLRVENTNVNLLYRKLTGKQFDEAYNFLNKYLNFDFSPIRIDGKEYMLLQNQQQYIEQETLTSSIYFFAVNKLKMVLKENKMDIKIPFDALLELLSRKYGIDTPVSLALGAHILRRPLAEYANSVKNRRQYYNK
jgi:hypothetical protein